MARRVQSRRNVSSSPSRRATARPTRAASRRSSSRRPARPSRLRRVVSALRAKAGVIARAARRRSRRTPATGKRSAATTAPLARRPRVQRVGRTPTWRTQRLRSKAPAAPPSAEPTQTASLPAAIAAPGAPGPASHDRPAPSREPAAWSSVEERFAIPAAYGETVLVLMVRDPWWIHAYWEVCAGVERAARSQLQPEEVSGLQSVLRVYDVSEAAPSVWIDVPLSGLATNWYIHTDAPNRSFVVELGLLTAAGRFLPLVRSNQVTTPRDGPSDIFDEAWRTTEEAFAQLMGVAEVGLGASPAGWAARGWRHLFAAQRSSAHLAGVPAGSGLRGLWVRVDTDLVIYGATDPRAKIAIQGQPVTVRKDGTFSLRVALPDGTQSIAIDVTSPDGRQTRTVAPLVTLARPAADAAAPVSLPVKPAGSSRG